MSPEAFGTPGLTLALALAAGVLAQALARHIRVPGIVLLLAAGVSLGPEFAGWVQPRALGSGLFEIVHLGVAVILFEGGLNLQFSRLRRQSGPIRRLVTLGAILTLLGAMLTVRLALGWSWDLALLFGSLVVVTGPTVVTPLLRELRLQPRVSTILEAEGVLIDPIGAILAVITLQIVVDPALRIGGELLAFVGRFGFGLLAGSLAGLVLAGLLRVRRVVPEGHENIFTLASVLLLFHGSNALVEQSGMLAVVVAGIWVGNLRTRVDRDLREFKDQLTVLLIGLLFVLLAADVRLEDVRALGWQAVTVIGALVLLVRPGSVWLATAGFALPWRDRVFIGWLAPRGIVAAAIASLTANLLEQSQLEGGAQLRALVFLTIASTVLLAGASAGPMSRLLRLRLPERTGIAILGAQGLAMLLAEELRKGGRSVTLLDSNPQQCRRAEEAGFSVVFGNALEERTLARARFELIGTAIGLTANETLNSLFVNRARERFKVPRGYVGVMSLETGVTPTILAERDVKLLFERVHDVERWDVRARHSEIVLEHLLFTPPDSNEDLDPIPDPPSLEAFVILSIRRGERVFPMGAETKLKAGDVAAIAIHAPQLEEVVTAFQRSGWTTVPEPPEAPGSASSDPEA